MFGIFKSKKQKLVESISNLFEVLDDGINSLFSFVSSEAKYQHFFLASYAFLDNSIRPLGVETRVFLELFDNIMSKIPQHHASVNKKIFFDEYSKFVNLYLAQEFAELTNDEKILMQWGADWRNDEKVSTYLSSYFFSEDTLPEKINYFSDLEKKYALLKIKNES